MPLQPVLLVDHGDLPSLVALALEPEPGRLLLWHPRSRDEAARRRAEIVSAHAQAYSVCGLIDADRFAIHCGLTSPQAGLAEARLMLEAIIEARTRGCTKIIWPQAAGWDIDLVGAIVERASLMRSLADLDGPPEPPMIDLPVVDLADSQLVDLAQDIGAPMRDFWPCQAGGLEPCGSCDECRRWHAAFDSVHVTWPWAPAGAMADH